MAPDPTFAFVGGPCCPTLDLVIAIWIMIYVLHIVTFAILYSEVVSLPLESILSKISRYDADLSDSGVSYISSSSEYIKWT